jgi:ABC-2 type transport system permease protein
MKAALRKYMAAFRLKLQDTLEYRANMVLGNLTLFLPLAGVLVLWAAVYRKRTEIQGWTFGEIITYFIAARAVGSMLWVNLTQDIEKDIKDGPLAKYLLMPFSYFWYWLSVVAAEKVINAVVVAVFLLVLAIFFSGRFMLQGDPALLGLAGLSMLLAFFINFCMSFTVCLSAFWMNEIWAVGFTKDMFQEALSGGVFPLVMLPPLLYHAALYLPFAYCLHFPLMIYLGKLSPAEMAQGFAIQGAYALLLYGLSQLVWRLGVRRFEAVGA